MARSSGESSRRRADALEGVRPEHDEPTVAHPGGLDAARVVAHSGGGGSSAVLPCSLLAASAGCSRHQRAVFRCFFGIQTARAKRARALEAAICARAAIFVMFFSERNFPNNLLVPPSDDMVGD